MVRVAMLRALMGAWSFFPLGVEVDVAKLGGEGYLKSIEGFIGSEIEFISKKKKQLLDK